MADNTQLNKASSAGDIIASDAIVDGAGQTIKHQRVKVQFGDDGSATDVSAATPLPVTDAAILTELQLKADLTERQPVHVGAGDLQIDAWGNPKFVQDVSLFHGMFTYDIPQSMWLFYEDDAEVLAAAATRATSTRGVATVTSGATATNNAWIGTRRHSRYQPNRGIHFAASMFLPSVSAGGINKFGLGGDMENGFYFKTVGDGKLYACIMANSVETHAEEITIPFSIDLTKGNIYDIQAKYRGVGGIKYFIGNPATETLVLVHQIDLLNMLSTTLSCDNAAFSLFMSAENVSAEVSIKCGCMDLSAEGGEVDEHLQYAQADDSAAVTQGNGFLAIRQPATIGGAINTRDIQIHAFDITSSKKATIDLYHTRDATSVVGGAWVAVGGGSYVEVNKTMTSVVVGTMKKIGTMQVATNVPARKEFDAAVDTFAVHGEYIVMVLRIGTTPTIESSIEWGEEV